MLQTLVPTWFKEIVRPLYYKTLEFYYKSHEKVSNYEAPKDFDRGLALARAEASGGDIETSFWAHEGRFAHKWPHYFAIYERLFEKYRAGFRSNDGTLRPLRFLEIGVSHGGSLQLWRKYFGPDAIIYGVDIDQRCTAVDDANLCVRVGSQDDAEFLRRVVDEMGGVDVVLDDGSHVAKHQRSSFDCLFPLLSDGGLYLVEDVQTAYWRQWQGGYRRSGTFIEVAKSVVDDMHARYHKSGAKRTFAENEIISTSFYDGIVAFEKSVRPKSYHARVGHPSF